MADSIRYFIQFSFFYFLFLIFIPAKVMKLKLSGKDAVENMLKAMISSHVVVISCVYFLGIFHIYNTVTLVIALCISVLVYWKFHGVCYRDVMKRFFSRMARVSDGQYKMTVLVRRSIQKWGKEWWNACKTWLKQIFSPDIIRYEVLFISIGILIERKWSLVFNNYAYLTSDMYVHNEWINFLEKGDIFHEGVYPFGMHNMLSAFHKLSGLNLNVVFRYWGAYNCLLMVVMLYFFARKIFRGKYTALLPVVVYCITDFASGYYGYRTIYTLPQEVGMLFLFPCAYFGGKFLKNEKWQDGLYFALSASVILSAHFYTVMIAILLCGSICIPFIKKLWNISMLKKTLAYVGLIVLIGITPLVLGRISGKQWQGSMTWALNVMNEQSGENTEQEPEAGESDSYAKSMALEIYELQLDEMNSDWGTVFWICMGLSAVYYVFLLLLKKADWGAKMYAGIFFFLVFMIILYSHQILGIPRLMKEERMTIFIGYITPVILALPIEILDRIYGRWEKGREPLNILCSMGMIAALFYATYVRKYIPVQSYFYLENSLAAKACVMIDEEYPKNTWTVVSPVEELAFTRNHGFHYELWEFISSMEMYEENMYLEIPTPYVFFVLEKNPIVYNQYRSAALDYAFEPIHEEDAQKRFTGEALGISETGVMGFYNILENRRIMEAKLFYWLAEYQKAFPNQMEIYMEDDECIIYKFEQNPYMYNNFAIDYEYNS